VSRVPPPTGSAVARCPWVGTADAEYARYHDEEWGVPHSESDRLFEKICLEGFQAGLSWLTILKKRESFRAAFHGFDAARIARYTTKDVDRLMADPGIVRNRAKILATIGNANAVIALSGRMPLAHFLWQFLPDGPLLNRRTAAADVPTETDLSKRVSKALKAEGFRFVGPTTVYAFLQSSGFVNDHLISCHRHAACERQMRGFKVPKA